MSTNEQVERMKEAAEVYGWKVDAAGLAVKLVDVLDQSKTTTGVGLVACMFVIAAAVNAMPRSERAKTSANLHGLLDKLVQM